LAAAVRIPIAGELKPRRIVEGCQPIAKRRQT